MAKKKFYQKPEIKRVKLASEEAVLSGCKTGSGKPGATEARCAPNVGDPCLTFGS